jgi:hypothetical protein
MGRSAVVVDVGKVETPPSLALRMVEKLFGGGPPPVGSRVLDAGCGRGVFVEALLSYLEGRGVWWATFCLWGRRSWGPLRLRDQQPAVCVV